MARWTEDLISEVVAAVRARSDDRVAEVFERCFADTLHSTMTPMPDGTVFMLTGDIPAMWLRDSTAQLTPYLHFAADHPELADLLIAVNRRQLDAIGLDPYANAFNAEPNGHGHQGDVTDGSPWVWERKYEIDSLCYPLQLAHDLWITTGRTEHLDERYRSAVGATIALWRTEQRHEERSPYRFQRFDAPLSDTLVRDGLGPETVWTGLSWSGFRPSDDAGLYGYNVPGNAFAAVTLAGVEAIAAEVLQDEAVVAEARALRAELETALAEHGVVRTSRHGDVYAYEVDGRGNALLMDDANVPSLLSLPFLGWCEPDDERYQATRAFILSEDDPSYSVGSAARGIGSPHTPPDHIWPIALSIEGLTSRDPQDRARLLETLLTTHAGTGVMHESFHKDDPDTFTRPWFSWANAMFCEFVLDLVGLRTHVRRSRSAVTPS